MDFLTQLASNNGLLGLLLTISILGNLYQFRLSREDGEKRVADLLGAREAYLSALRDLINNVNNMEKTLDTVVQVLNSIRISKPGGSNELR